MYDLEIVNARGAALTFNKPGAAYTIVEIDGLYPPNADIGTDTLALLDGAQLSYTRISTRTLRIAFVINGAVETNRLKVYSVLRMGQTVTVRYASDKVSLNLTAYVQSVQVSHFAVRQTVTATLTALDPYWYALTSDRFDMSHTSALFHFPFYSTVAKDLVMGVISADPLATVAYAGSVATGLIITAHVEQAITRFRLIDYYSGEYFGVEYDFETHDVLQIDTRPGHKTATLTRGGGTTSLIGYLEDGTTWLMLPPNGTTLIYTVAGSEAENVVRVTLEYTARYLGV